MGVSVKTLKRMLKKKGLKSTGRKAALTRRAKKAHLMRGGAELKFNARVSLFEDKGDAGMAFSPQPAEFVRKHAKKIIRWIGEKKGPQETEAVGLTWVKDDMFQVQVQYDDRPTPAVDAAGKAKNAKAKALAYFYIEDVIVIDNKMYHFVIDESR